MRLRVTVDYHDGVEPRLSLAARLAFANGYPSLRDFLAVNSLSLKALETGQPKAIAMLADWAGIDVERLKGNDIKSVGVSDVWQLGEASMSRDMRPGKTHRYCPKCVMEDMECGSGRSGARPFVRMSWLTRAVQQCTSHCTEIVEADDPKGQRDFPRYVEKYLLEIQQQASAIADAVPTFVAEYVETRIRGGSSNEFLDTLATHVAVDLCRNLGRFEIEHAPNEQLPDSSWQVETMRGFTRASAGPSAIETVVADAVDRERPIALEMNAFFRQASSLAASQQG
ncbi:TniQ family protein [Neorhizobium huautlense]|uniref:TniQ family protein n=1 Tax=Neorhizobium huautlense TaxID=67774 RepID=UPI000CF86060|nr:TniQ family protein [Neorhizobium huautlense]